MATLPLALAACAAGPAPKSGFLGDYSKLIRPGKSASLLEQKPPADFRPGDYHAVLIDPPEIRVDGLSDADRRQLASVFRETLLEQVDGQLPLVERSGPGVLRVRSAIITVRKANVPINIVTGVLGAPLSPTMGGVAAEAEVLDGLTGRRIVALSWAHRGAKMKEMGLTYTRLGEARSGLRIFARRLAQLFSEPKPGKGGSRASTPASG